MIQSAERRTKHLLCGSVSKKKEATLYKGNCRNIYTFWCVQMFLNKICSSSNCYIFARVTEDPTISTIQKLGQVYLSSQRVPKATSFSVSPFTSSDLTYLTWTLILCFFSFPSFLLTLLVGWTHLPCLHLHLQIPRSSACWCLVCLQLAKKWTISKFS